MNNKIKLIKFGKDKSYCLVNQETQKIEEMVSPFNLEALRNIFIREQNIPIVNRVVTSRNCAEVSFNNDDFIVLFSYDKAVAAVLNRSKPASERLHCSIDIMGTTKTTRKHIKEFFTIYGFRDLIPVETNEKELMELVAGK